MRSLRREAESASNNNKPLLSLLPRVSSDDHPAGRSSDDMEPVSAADDPEPGEYRFLLSSKHNGSLSFGNRCFTRHLNIDDTKFLPIAFTNQPLCEGHVLTLEVHRVHSTSTNQDNDTMIIGVMTCDPRTVQQLEKQNYENYLASRKEDDGRSEKRDRRLKPAHLYTCCRNQPCCGLLADSLILQVRKCSSEKKKITMSRREGQIVVTVEAGKEDEDEEHVLRDERRTFVSRPAHPFIILNGYVRSVRIIDPPIPDSPPCGLLLNSSTTTSGQQLEDKTVRDGAIAGPIIRCPDPDPVIVLDDDDEDEHVHAFVSVPVPKPAANVPESATGCLPVPDRVPDVPPITEVVQSEEDREVEEILRPTGMPSARCNSSAAPQSCKRFPAMPGTAATIIITADRNSGQYGGQSGSNDQSAAQLA